MMGRIVSTKLVLPKWLWYGMLNRVIRVGLVYVYIFVLNELSNINKTYCISAFSFRPKSLKDVALPAMSKTLKLWVYRPIC